MIQTHLSWVPTADQINSIKPDQAVMYWSGSVGMSGRGGQRSGSEDRIDYCYPTATRPYTIISRLLFDHTRALYPIRSTTTRVILDRFVRLVVIELMSTWSS
ncbi:hypothetical protein DPMN_101865 [Dreissena polymorpha]|uniref:Uncharacterized protein n=1 Tax=Dreissena polymorpha TaxID=45954 RepID=A0A9D4LK22_DREPO|nr:hypothetical protein DPMN_101865 [Dreissena polymorpha]